MNFKLHNLLLVFAFISLNFSSCESESKPKPVLYLEVINNTDSGLQILRSKDLNIPFESLGGIPAQSTKIFFDKEFEHKTGYFLEAKMFDDTLVATHWFVQTNEEVERFTWTIN